MDHEPAVHEKSAVSLAIMAGSENDDEYPKYPVAALPRECFLKWNYCLDSSHVSNTCRLKNHHKLVLRQEPITNGLLSQAIISSFGGGLA